MNVHRLVCFTYLVGLTDDAREVQALEQDAKPPPTVRIEGLLDSRKADGPVDTHPQAVGKATTTATAAGLQCEVSFMTTPWIYCAAVFLGDRVLCWLGSIVPAHPLCIFAGNASENNVNLVRQTCSTIFCTIHIHNPASRC